MDGKVDGSRVFGIIEYGREVTWTRFGPVDALDESLNDLDSKISAEHDPRRRLVLLLRCYTILIIIASPASLTGEIMALLAKTAQVLPELLLITLINFAESCMQIGDTKTAQMFLHMAIKSASKTMADQIAASVAEGMLESIEPSSSSEPIDSLDTCISLRLSAIRSFIGSG